MNSAIGIVAHGNPDGVTSAALLAEQLGIKPEDLNVIFTKPYLVDQIVIPDDIEKVYVVDIAINNRNPGMTEKFIAYLGPKLALWYDHHQGWWEDVTEKFVIHPTAPACAAILGSGMPPRLGHLHQAVFDAIASDTREGEISKTGLLIEHAIKADVDNDDIRLAAVKLLMGVESQRPVLEAAAKKYAAIQDETERISMLYICDPQNISPFKIVPAKLALVDATESNHKYDLTQLLLAGQKLATFAVVKAITLETKEEMVTIATISKTNLVELFELGSGATFRVTLPASRLDEVIEKLNVVD